MLTRRELAEEAAKLGIDLGANPTRTIKYYHDLGLLKAQITQQGSYRRALYPDSSLTLLSIIREELKSGKTLMQIRAGLHESIYLSPEGRQFLEQYRGQYPEDAFAPAKPVTREEFAFFVYRAIEALGPTKAWQLVLQAFVRPGGGPVLDRFSREVANETMVATSGETEADGSKGDNPESGRRV